MNRPLIAFYWIVSGLLLFYVVLCALYVPFTVDEVWTYNEFIKGDFWNVVAYAHPTANNHILNSILAKPFAAISNSELLLRMPNVLAYVLYLYSSYKIAKLLCRNKYLQVCLFMALQCNITMLQFFALCRGYGLSIGLMTFAIMQLILYIKAGYPKVAIHLSLLTIVLAMYASFTLIYVMGAIFLSVFIISFYNDAKTNPKKFFTTGIGIPFLYFLLALLLCFWPIKRAIAAGEFYWGGDKNFVDDTLFSFLQDIVGYNTADSYRDPAMICLIALVTVPIITVLVKKWKGDIASVIIPLILLWCMFCMNVQFYFFTGKLIMHRTALYLFPLIILSAFSSINLLKNKWLRISHIGSVMVTSVLIIVTVYQLNLTTIEEWWFDADNKEILSYMSKDGKYLNHKIKVLPFVYCGNSLNYYIERKYRGVFAPIANVRAEEVENYLEYDYLYLQKYYRFKQEDSFVVIRDNYCNNRMKLYKRK